MSEALNYIKNTKDEGKEVKTFIKKFIKINTKDAVEFKEEVKKLNLMKLGEEEIVKIVDIVPENEEDLSKIVVGVSLDEEESKKILEISKRFK